MTKKWFREVWLLTVVVLTVGSLKIEACGLSDDKFRKGEGNLTGVVKVNEETCSGAQIAAVNRNTGAQAIAKSDQNGVFLLQNLPVGKNDIIIRALGEKKAYRADVWIVADEIYDMQDISLTQALDIKVVVKNPQLPICRAKVGIKELPELEIYTNFNGEAVIPCLPEKGCYNLVVLENENGFVFKEQEICPKGLFTSYEQFVINPEAEEHDLMYRSQIHNAYARMNAVLSEFGPCESSCEIPNWWMEQIGPPCPWGIKYFSIPSPVVDQVLRPVVDGMNSVRINRSGIWRTIQCPQGEILQTKCNQNKCVLHLSHTLLEAKVLCSGGTTINENSTQCGENITFATRDENQIFDKIAKMQNCFDTSSCPSVVEPLDGKSIYVLFTYDVYIEDPCLLELFAKQGDQCGLYYRCSIDPTIETSKLFAGSWFLYRLTFSDPPPTPNNCTYKAYLSWIDSKGSFCQFEDTAESNK